MIFIVYKNGEFRMCMCLRWMGLSSINLTATVNYSLMSLLLCIFRQSAADFPVRMPNISALVGRFQELRILEPASDSLYCDQIKKQESINESGFLQDFYAFECVLSYQHRFVPSLVNCSYQHMVYHPWKKSRTLIFHRTKRHKGWCTFRNWAPRVRSIWWGFASFRQILELSLGNSCKNPFLIR